jgi:hypothetical protein
MRMMLRRADGWLGLTSSNTLPDIYTSSLGIPYAALRVEIPVDVSLPDPGGVADYGGHR